MGKAGFGYHDFELVGEWCFFTRSGAFGYLDWFLRKGDFCITAGLVWYLTMDTLWQEARVDK